MVLAVVLALGWVIWGGSGENASEVLLNAKNSTPDNGLTLVQDNSLMAISPVIYPNYRVYGSIVSEIIECESGGKHDGVWGKAGEYGIAQFMEKTFYWLAQKANLQNSDWKNKDQQLWLLNWAVQNGYQDEWTCWKLINK